MTVVTINKNHVKKIIGNKNDEEIDHILSMMSCAVEKIDLENIEVEIAPNRPDMLSEQGILRSLKTFASKEKGLAKIKINKPQKDYDVFVDSNLKNIRPFTACAIVKGLKFDDEKIKEIIDLQEKLHNTLGRKRKKAAIGIYPLEKIKLPIKFIAKKPEEIKFIPLEFNRELNANQILSQHPTGRDYGFLMQGLPKYSIFIDANNEVLSLPPIINSEKTGKVSHQTKDIFIECSGFDLELLKKILNIICYSLSDLGGQVFEMNVHYSNSKIITPDLNIKKMKLNISNANKLIGINLKESEIKILLQKMGLEYNNGIVSIPPYRIDITNEVDIIEDIAIAYGYDNLVPSIPQISTIGNIAKEEIIKDKITQILVGIGLIQTSSLHLTTKEFQIIKPELKNQKFIEILDSKTDYNLLRKDLSHYMLRILGENVDATYPQDIFQIGKIFSGKEGLEEKEHLSIALAPGNFTKIKQILEYLSKMLDLKLEIENTKEINNYLIEGRIGNVKINGKQCGFFGEVHPKIIRNFKIKMPVALLEINIDEIIN